MPIFKNIGIQKFILDRIAEINDEIIVNDPKYKELTEKSIELSKKILRQVNPEDKKLLDEQEDICLAQLCRHEEIIYVEALKDGILFGYWVAMVGLGQGVGEIEV